MSISRRPAITRPARAALAAAVAAILLVGCGGGPDPEELLDSAFSETVGSAQASLGLDLELQGVPGLTEPVRLQLEGPYRSAAEDELPAFDFTVAVDAPVPGQALELTSTGGNLFVTLAGTAYEVGEDAVAEQLAADAANDDEDGLAALGVDPRSWVEDPSIEGEEEIDGVQVTHVTGVLSVPAMVADLNSAAQNASTSGDQTAPVLTDEQIAQIEETVENPAFDLYVGEDGKIRRLSASITFAVPEADRAGIGGLESGRLGFELELSAVGEPVTIEPPEDPRPIEELTEQIQALTGGLVAPQEVPGGSGAGAVPGGSDGGPAPGGAGADAFERYAECLKDADPADPAAVAACGELLGAQP
ncbi:MAG: hypothetical protein H0U42_06395 [Thermoleophilaceae bacterium]|nr:hypothetical protein [Thermoleophilaceae bacterium]